MKIILCTTPIRPTPTDYPPFGALAIIQALRDAGYDPAFYDIDGLRPSFYAVIQHIRTEQPDVLLISAVVSTAYAYVKRLGKWVKKVSPRTRIVVGGNLAASAELLHRKCSVDICVIGEGERIIVNLMKHYADGGHRHEIKGITFLNQYQQFVFTGYETAIPAAELADPDYSILEKHTRIQNFITRCNRKEFIEDPRTVISRFIGKRTGTVTSAKGCVAR